jgi:hypothetical protein
VRRSIGALAGIALAISAIAAPSAGAATEIGSNCAANASEPNVTAVQLQEAPGSVLPITAPGAGVLTAWTVRVDPSAFVEESDRLKLVVLRSQTNPSKLENIGESPEEKVVHGTNSFKARMPVLAGDRLGLYGGNSPGTLICTTSAPEDEAGILRAPAPLGSINTFPPVPKVQVPVSATVEPDRDGDGYGDETQDQCPQSATIQVACPPVTLHDHAVAKKRSILLRVTASSEARVHAYGQVSWGFKPKPKPHGHPGGRTGLVVGLSGGTKNVVPGRATVFKIPFSKPILRRLGRLSPQESLKAMLTLSAKDSVGRVTYSKLTVILKGQSSGG